jgi:hypothetical protein
MPNQFLYLPKLVPNMSTATTNPFDLNLSRAFSAPEAFFPRPELREVIDRAAPARLWTLVEGARRMGKSSAVIAICAQARLPLLHIDLMGVTSSDDVAERFRWGRHFFAEQGSRSVFRGIKPELSAKIPGIGIGVKISGEKKAGPGSAGEVLMEFDKAAGKGGGVLFLDEIQDLARLPESGERQAQPSRRLANDASHHAGVRRVFLSPASPTVRNVCRGLFQEYPFAAPRRGSRRSEFRGMGGADLCHPAPFVRAGCSLPFVHSH